jgi:hypothetical protein
MKISKEDAEDIVARISGVKETDTVVEAAEKVIATMKFAGLPKKAIRNAEKLVADYKKRIYQ